jgi:hypothetical protein
VAAVLAAGVLVYAHYAGANPLLDPLYDLWLRRQSLESLARRHAVNPQRAPVVVTLTTLPSRIDRIQPTIKSLLNQTVSPDVIRLNVPAMSRREQRPYVIPEWLARLPAVTICPCDDFGPATKLIPTLLASGPNDRLIVVDDDRIYHRHFVEQMVGLADAHPGTAVAGSGWNAPHDRIDRPSTLAATLRGDAPVPLHCTRVGRGRQVDIVRGASGYLVTPAFFDRAGLLNYSGAPEAAFFVDDVWISAHCVAPKFVWPGRRTNFPSLADRGFFEPSSLGSINCTGPDENRNNTTMLRYFTERWGRR